MNFAPRAARRHIAENALQIADAGREILHFAQALVHLFQTFADQPERFAQPRFERGLEFFIDGLPHLFEFAALSV